MRTVPNKILSIISLGLWAFGTCCAMFLALWVRVDSAGAYEYSTLGWEKPKMYGALRYGDEQIDFDKNVPGDETRLEKFKTTDGGRIFRYSHNGRVFSYEVDHDEEEPMDYEIVDMNGSGLFEIKQSPYSEYPLPKWTREEGSFWR